MAMSKISFNGLFNPVSNSFPFLLSGFALLLINFVFVGFSRVDFMYALPYSFALIGLGLLVGQSKPDLVGSLSCVFLCALPLMASTGFMDATVSTIIAALLFVVVIANFVGLFRYKSGEGNRFLALPSMMLLIIWIGSYFYARFSSALPLNTATILYHGGVALLCVAGMAQLTSKKQMFAYVAIAGLLLTVLGAVWLAGPVEYGCYGWGLNLLS